MRTRALFAAAATVIFLAITCTAARGDAFGHHKIVQVPCRNRAERECLDKSLVAVHQFANSSNKIGPHEGARQ
jgi:hypothetical protein